MDRKGEGQIVKHASRPAEAGEQLQEQQLAMQLPLHSPGLPTHLPVVPAVGPREC